MAEQYCDFCARVKAVLFCKSDSARLCLRCDGCVHSINDLSSRHYRTLLCDKCSHPAIIRCLDQNLSLCQACAVCYCSSDHRNRVKIYVFNGCPGDAEYSRIWSWILEWGVPSGFGIAGETATGTDAAAGEDSVGMVANVLNEIASVIRPCALLPPPPSCSDSIPSFHKGCADSAKDPVITSENGDLCDNVDDESMSLSFDGASEIFGNMPSNPDTNIALLEKNLSVSELNSIEASSSAQQDCTGFELSPPAPGAGTVPNLMPQAMLMTPSIGLGYSGGQVPSTMSLTLSSITVESSGTEYQDCGLSPLYLAGDVQWDSSFDRCSPEARDKAKIRYNEKKKMRTFDKQIRYASRKARADTRKRIKGRFVKASEAGDYDPGGAMHL